MSTHQQLLYHIVFSTKNRQRWLNDAIRDDVFSYLAATCRELDGFALIVGGYYDHVHLLVRIPTKVAVAEFVGKIKASSSRRINQNSGVLNNFGWQDGYGVFTVSTSMKDTVYTYIANQMEHHSRQSFEEEYVILLKKHGVDYNPTYVFD
ncbi:MAG: IS200/IS605 family transposase [Planctomycetaceae bacterium]|nr:IS200/IS605 family transposase [Planctomycetaceae bacterium]